jgi:phosphoglucosamine mutase
VTVSKTNPPRERREVVIRERSAPPPRSPSLRPSGLGEAPRFFGLYGLRGRANVHPVTPEVALRIGRAVTWLAARGVAHAPRILLAKDTRLSGYLFETAIASGICSAGGNVVLCGPMPTPALAHLTTSMRADAGIMVSASHNAYDDNGIKVFGRDGFGLGDESERELEQLMTDAPMGEPPPPLPTGAGIGRAERLDDAQGRYVVHVKNTFPADLSLDGLRVVVDSAHGAAYRVAPRVFSELGASVVSVGAKPDGTNINKKGGSLNPDRARVHVVRREASIGVALDGDGDRVILVDEHGQVVDGDVIMAICAGAMLDAGTLNERTVVGTHMSNIGLERALARRGARLLRTSVGERYVIEAMRRGGYTFGGEPSGHLVFLDQSRTGDGIVSALKVLAVMLRKGLPLSKLASEAMERVPQVVESIALESRLPLEQMPRLSARVAAITKELGDRGRLLVRWSQTEPKLRVMIEGPDADRIHAWAAELAAVAKTDVAS